VRAVAWGNIPENASRFTAGSMGGCDYWMKGSVKRAVLSRALLWAVTAKPT
jgi:hypothetical protein